MHPVRMQDPAGVRSIRAEEVTEPPTPNRCLETPRTLRHTTPKMVKRQEQSEQSESDESDGDDEVTRPSRPRSASRPGCSS